MQKDNDQAARRAQVAPHGWKLVPTEPTEDMTKAAWERGIREEAPDPYYAYKAMLAAAPQPPETEQCQSCRTGSPYACTCTFKTNRNSAPSCFEVEPVQLPDPAVVVICEQERAPYISNVFNISYGINRLFTEQQVRQLLAAKDCK